MYYTNKKKKDDEDSIIATHDGLIKEVNKKVYVTNEKGEKKQLLRETKYQI